MDLFLLAETTRPLPEGFLRLTEALKARFSQSWQVVLLYGSSLRTGDLTHSIADFYVLVSSYREAYPGRSFLALANWLLPPNVFSLELDGLRAKYAVVTSEQFRRKIEKGWHPYFWGRFCQPVRITAYRSPKALEETLQALVAAASVWSKRRSPCLRGPLILRPFGSRGSRTPMRRNLEPKGVSSEPGSSTATAGNILNM